MVRAIDRLIELDEQESARQLERLRLLTLMDAAVEALPDALVICDFEGNMVLFNTSAELMFGYHRSEVIGRKIEMLMPERARAHHTGVREMYGRFAVNERARTMGIGSDLTGIHKDGHEFSASITLARMVVRSGVFLLSLLRFTPAAPGPNPAASSPGPDRGTRESDNTPALYNAF